MIIADTSALVAYYDADERPHTEVDAFLHVNREPLVVSPYVIAELDHLFTQRHGVSRELLTLRELAGGAYDLPALDAADLAACADVIEKYADQAIGVADASIVVLAKRYGTRTILTLDRRHFDVLRPLDGGQFRIVP